MTQGRSDCERRIAEDKVRSKTGDRLQPAGTNGGEEGRQDRRTKGPVSIEYKFSIRDISNTRYGRKEGQCRGSMSIARYGRGKNNTGKIIWEKYFREKVTGKNSTRGIVTVLGKHAGAND
jgi:hypothetical protein